MGRAGRPAGGLPLLIVAGRDAAASTGKGFAALDATWSGRPTNLRRPTPGRTPSVDASRGRCQASRVGGRHWGPPSAGGGLVAHSDCIYTNLLSPAHPAVQASLPAAADRSGVGTLIQHTPHQPPLPQGRRCPFSSPRRYVTTARCGPGPGSATRRCRRASQRRRCRPGQPSGPSFVAELMRSVPIDAA